MSKARELFLLANSYPITYTISREMAPIYVMGSKTPLGFHQPNRSLMGVIGEQIVLEHRLWK